MNARMIIVRGIAAIMAMHVQTSQADVRGWFEENWFGKAPLERPTDETFGETNVMFAVGRISIPLEVQLPERLPAPVIIQLCFGDEEPLPEATRQGFALVRWQMDSVARNPRKAREPFDIAHNPAFREYGPKERTETSWGSVAAWAWGFRRVVDWVETRPELDAKRIAVVGFSRVGKAALWAGAQDERIALTVSCQSGCGGAMALKAQAEGAETLERLGVNFPNWMAGRLYAMAGKEDELEYDAPDLLKLFAPRKVLVLSANDAKWLGPEAEQAAAKEAGVLHWTRPGKHSMTADDWQEIFKVAKDTMCVSPAVTVGADGSVRIDGDRYGMNWMLAEGQYPFVTKDCVLGAAKCGEGFEAVFKAVPLPCGDVETVWTFTNTTDAPRTLGKFEIMLPFNDNYPSSQECVYRRCNAHIWTGGDVAWVSGIRMGGEAPHLGWVLTEGCLSGYEIHGRDDPKAKSNARGVIGLTGEGGEVAPGSSWTVKGRFFVHDGWDGFKAKLLDLGGVWVEKRAGRTDEAAELEGYFRKMCNNYIAAGMFVPKSEVNYEQSIIAPAANSLVEFYLATGERKYLDGALALMPAVEAFNGRQPSWHLNDIAIRHWDGYWFGKRKMFGDTFPHYWSDITADLFGNLAEATGDKNYLRRAKAICKANLGLLTEDGRGGCAYLYPDAVDGRAGKFLDPMANDQDWAIVFASRRLDELK